MDPEILIVGGGPAGAVCAAFCAAAGRRVLVVERAVFPRDKVCGDCLNPDAWPVLARLGLEERLRRAAPHGVARRWSSWDCGANRSGCRCRTRRGGKSPSNAAISTPCCSPRAIELGARVQQGRAVVKMQKAEGGYVMTTTDAAGGGGRAGGNGAVRGGGGRAQLGRGAAGRVARRCAASGGCADRVADAFAVSGGLRRAGADALVRGGLRWVVPGGRRRIERLADRAAGGVGGIEKVGARGVRRGQANRRGGPLRRWTARRPGGRRTAAFFLVGDAARVVEPFTGEGIYYALRSGELAAATLLAALRGELGADAAAARYRQRTRGGCTGAGCGSTGWRGRRGVIRARRRGRWRRCGGSRDC